MSYSLGGGVAFQTVVKYPELIRRLAMVSANLPIIRRRARELREYG